MTSRRENLLLTTVLPLVATVILLFAAGHLAVLAQEVPTESPSGDDPVSWRNCEIEGDVGALEAECGVLPVPLRYDQPQEDALELAVARHLGADGASSTRLWFVAGGPGDSGVEALGRLRALFPDTAIDLYTFDHRGVGGSRRLGCPVQEDPDSEGGREIVATEWPACIETIRAERDDLDALTVTAAARDLARLISTRPPGRDVVFGASYGTYLVNRTLLVAPTAADGVILDGIVPPDWTFAEFDANLSTAADRLLHRCLEDPDCRRHLGNEPDELARDVVRRFDEGHCAELQVDSRTVRLLLGNLMMAGPETWPYVPALIHRLDRCRFRDLMAVSTLVERLFESGDIGVEDPSHSPVLQRHVALSEMWPTPAPGPAELARVANRASMTTGVSVGFARTADGWPTYPPDPLTGRFADYDGPILMLHGGLDPTMPPERIEQTVDRLLGPEPSRDAGSTFVLFPDLGHVVLNDSDCARSLARSFILRPGAPLDTSCVAPESGTIPTALPPEAESALGTRDLWGDAVSPQEWQLLLLGLAVLGTAGTTGWLLWRRWTGRRRGG